MADTITFGQCVPIVLVGRGPDGVLHTVTTDGNGNLNSGGSSESETVTNGTPHPVMIYGRAPNGQLQAVTTDGNGNLS